MKHALALLGALALLAAGGRQTGDACDLRTVVKVFYCEADDAILKPADLVSKKVYFECADCGARAAAKGKCGSCGTPLEKRVSGVGVCSLCLEKPEPRSACEKKYFECPECSSSSKKAGACKQCKKAKKRLVSRALIEYACEGGCGAISPVAASCEDENCEGFGNPLVARCTQSGRFPHTTP
jgi:hypothetical protein